ncbi:MAG: hypothetical protein KDM64_11630, partial [Verrucomicrobiae bacterium]|nr:hypothetical protein [Verrucomicrobiae bacterium]
MDVFPFFRRRLAPVLCLSLFAVIDARAESTNDWHHAEWRRFPAAEANQGVAVDAECFYAITN